MPISSYSMGWFGAWVAALLALLLLVVCFLLLGMGLIGVGLGSVGACAVVVWDDPSMVFCLFRSVWFFL